MAELIWRRPEARLAEAACLAWECAKLIGRRKAACLSLGKAKLVGAKLVGAKLVGAKLVGAKLVGAKLVGAKLVGAKLVGAKLVGAKLVGAKLVGLAIESLLAKAAGSAEILHVAGTGIGTKHLVGGRLLRIVEEIAERDQNIALASRAGLPKIILRGRAVP